jgi:hypothetical protein
MRSDLPVAVKSGLEATLRSRKRLLHRSHSEKCRVTITGSTGESGTVTFALRGQHFRPGASAIEAAEISVSDEQSDPFAEILAGPPPGVATVDIVYEVRTGADA